jgi:hypothetical protein
MLRQGNFIFKPYLQSERICLFRFVTVGKLFLHSGQRILVDDSVAMVRLARSGVYVDMSVELFDIVNKIHQD